MLLVLLVLQLLRRPRRRPRPPPPPPLAPALVTLRALAFPNLSSTEEVRGLKEKSCTGKASGMVGGSGRENPVQRFFAL